MSLSKLILGNFGGTPEGLIIHLRRLFKPVAVKYQKNSNAEWGWDP